MISRDEALNIIKTHVKKENLIKHMIAAEAVMKGIAELKNEDTEKFGLAGLLHDVDYDITANDPEQHGIKAMDILKEYNLSDDILHAIKAHAGNGIERTSLMDKALFAADPVTGLVTAAALMHPSKQLKNLKLKSLKKRFKDKRFAMGADRDQIRTCSELDMELVDFLELALESMKKVDSELGLD